MRQSVSPELLPTAGILLKENTPTPLAEFLRTVARRYYLLILLCTAISAGIGAGYLFFTRPMYTASATMMIDSRRGGIQQKSVLGDAEPTDSAWIDSQIGVLVLERGKIGQAITEQFLPEFKKSPESLRNQSNFVNDFLESADRLTAGYFGFGAGHKEAPPPTDAETRQALAGIIANGLDVKRVGLSYLVNINFSSTSQALSAKIANAAADAYVLTELKAKEQDLRQASDWLQERYQTLRDQASAADRAVIEFKNKNHIVTNDGKLISDQRVGAISTELASARTKTADREAKLEEITKIIKEQEETGEVDSTVADAILNPIVTRLRGQYLDLANKEADWSKRFGQNHQVVVSLRNQMKDIRNSTHEELKRIAQAYKSDYEIAQRDETELQKQLDAVVAHQPNDAQITLRSLEQTAQSYRTFYDNFFLHYTESIQQQSSPIPDTRVISYAPYAYQSFPSPPRVIVLSLLAGVAAGFGVGALRARSDRALRTGPEVENLLRRHCLAMIPVTEIRASVLRAIGPPRLSGPDWGESAVDVERVIHYTPATARTLIDLPFSMFAETIRMLKMSADLRREGASCQVLGLTSSLPQEGKSAIAAALAGLTGLVGARVILIDCDLRNPALTSSMTPTARIGLLEVLSGAAALDNAIWRDPVTGIDFLPAVGVRRLSNTAQLLGSAAMRRIFSELRRRYDYVIVDLSPLLPVVDVRATSDIIDFYLFIVEWGRTQIELIYDALNSAQLVYDKILGVALNKVNQRAIEKYYSYQTASQHGITKYPTSVIELSASTDDGIHSSHRT